MSNHHVNFSYINPCGFETKGVTSMAKELDRSLNFGLIKEQLRDILMRNFLSVNQ